MANAHDPRVTPARPDVAADFLRNQIDAERYDPGMTYQVAHSVLPIRKIPAHDGPQETQCLFGEVFTVFDREGDWAWGQAAFDNYVGYVDARGLSDQIHEPTHRITALRTYRFSKPDLKSAPLDTLCKNAKLTRVDEQDGFVKEARGGWVWRGHTSAYDQFETDPVQVASEFLGAPYFWGGRESLGLDCSALIQNGYEATGRNIPRDADMQEAYFKAPENGQIIWSNDAENHWQDLALQRGDLLFWPGHVGVMVDASDMVHANATHMATTIDDVRAISQKWESEKALKMRTIVRPK